MGASASPYELFRRAIDRGFLVQAEAAARELGRLRLDDSLALVLLMVARQDGRWERAAVRWLGQVLAQCPELGLESAKRAAEALAGLNGVAPEVSRARLALVLRGVNLMASAKVLERAR